MSNQGKIEIIEPGNPGFELVDFDSSASSRTASNEFYNSVADIYNEGLGVGDIAIILLPERVRSYNFKLCIFNRGLEDGEDAIIAISHSDAAGRLLPKGEKAVKIKRLSEMRIRKVGDE